MNAVKIFVFDLRLSVFIGGPIFFTVSGKAAAYSGEPTA
jgi:hypothetical protein